MAELPCHIDLLRWVTRAFLLSFLHDPGAYWDSAKPSQTHTCEGCGHSALGSIGFLKGPLPRLEDCFREAFSDTLGGVGGPQ